LFKEAGGKTREPVVSGQGQAMKGGNDRQPVGGGSGTRWGGEAVGNLNRMISLTGKEKRGGEDVLKEYTR